MKSALLMTILTVSGLFAVKVDINVQGTLTCDKPFYAKVIVTEVDEFLNPDDDIGTQEFPPTTGTHSVHFNISGTAEDSAGQSEVEPKVKIVHTCGEFVNLCMEYTGITAENSKIVLDVDLKKPQIGKC